jgi:hypothetical protein
VKVFAIRIFLVTIQKKMRALLLAVNGLILLTWATDLVQSESQNTFTTKKWFVKPYHGAYAKGDVAFQSSKGQNGEATANKANLQSNINVQGKGDYNANRAGSSQSVVAKNPKGNTATADRSKKDQGLRTGDAGKYHGDLKNSKSGNDQNWNTAVNTGQKFDTVMHGNKESFDATGSKGNKYNVDPATQDKTKGNGVIARNGEKYNYQNQRAANGDVNGQLTNVGTGSNRKTYTCQGQKSGISNCIDQNGLKYGEVVEQPDGTVIVKKTISKGVDVPIAKSKATKQADGKSVVSVNDGMFQCQAGNYKQRDCMSDYAKTPGQKVQVLKPFTVKYNSESKDGRRTFQFPDCVTFGGKITLPPGMDANKLALQFDISILPAGKLKCVDPGSCNKDCYYCNFCNNTRKLQMASNGDMKNICNTKGGGTYPVSVTACPPPDAFDKGMCTGFTKSDPTYFKKKGDLQTRLLIWKRPDDEPQLKADYFNKVNGNNALKMILKTQFTIDNKQFINANNPTDFDLCEYYIKKNSKSKEQIVGCIEGTTNYTMSSQKIRTDFLLEAGTIAAAPKTLFDTKPCPQVDQINQAQAQADQAEAAKNAPKSSGWANQFGSFFGGR